MRYAKIERNSIANGAGIRCVLWVQGCRLNCKGCHNPQTHSFKGGYEFDSNAIQQICNELEKPHINGITFSGGHPLEPENIEECTALCHYIKIKYPTKNIWLYTGLLWEDIKNLPIMKYIDVLVDGRFILEQRNISLPYCGSNNQRVIDVQKSLANDKIELYKSSI